MALILEGSHTIRPLTDQTFDRWVQIYGEIFLPAFARHGIELLGWFKRSGGRMGQDFLLMRLDGPAELAKAMTSLRSDIPVMTKMITASQQFGIVMVYETSIVGSEVPFASKQHLDRELAFRPKVQRQYVQTVLDVPLAHRAKAYKLIAKGAESPDPNSRGLVTAYQASSMKVVTKHEAREASAGAEIDSYKSSDLSSEALTSIWVLSHPPDLSYRRSASPNELTASLREIAPEQSLYYLNPLPGSPLQ